jgi:hypothetical protein
MNILSTFLFVFLVIMAFYSPASAQRGDARPVSSGNSKGQNNKQPDYERHIFKKRDADDFEEYVDETI